MRVRAVIAAAVLSTSAVAPRQIQAQVAPTFAVQTPDLTADGLPAAIASGDLDGDGNIDLAVANSDTDDVSIFWGNGNGTFTAAAATLPVGTNAAETPVAIALADLNGDGKLDIITVNNSTDTVAVLLNMGQRLFGAALPSPTGMSPEGLVVDDFNGDHIPDVATPNFLDDTVTILLGHNGGQGKGDGTFTLLSTCTTQPAQICTQNSDCPSSGTCTPAPINVGAEPTAIAASDLNNDGKVDLIVANSSGGPVDTMNGSITVLKGLGGGMFIAQPEINSLSFDTPMGVTSTALLKGKIVPLDLDENTKPDIVVVNEGNDSLSVFYGNGDLSFMEGAALPVGDFSLPEKAVAADFNGDQHMDIATFGSLLDKVTVFAGIGDGTFTTPGDFFLEVGSNPFDITAADFNKDGKPDLATANMIEQGTASVLLNTTVPCIGDCSGNQMVTVDEISTLVGIALGTFPLSSCPDGVLDSVTVTEINTAVFYALNGCPTG